MNIEVKGDIATLTCVEPCICCNWRTGSFNISSDEESKSTSLVGDARGPKAFLTQEAGKAFMKNGVPTIAWQGDRHWADWIKTEVVVV